MSITYTNTITPASVSIKDACIDSSNNQIYIVESTTPSLRKYDLSTMAQVGSNYTCLASPGAVCLINSASAVVQSFSGSTIDFIEVATGFRSNVAGGASCPVTTKSQQIAADTALGIAWGCSSTAQKMVKVVASTFTVTNPTLNFLSTFTANSVIYKSSGRWLVGGSYGLVYEIDGSGNIADSMTINETPNSGVWGSTGSWIGTSTSPKVLQMSYDNNMLLLGTDDQIFLYDWSTKTKLYQNRVIWNNSGANTTTMCASFNGETLLGCAPNAAGLNGTVKELDFTVNAVQNQDTLFIDNAATIFWTGFNSGNTTAAAIDATNSKIRVFSVSQRATTTRTFTVQASSVDLKNVRLILIDDTGGIGATKPMLDTIMNSPAVYRVPTGKTIKEIVKYQTGISALWDYSEYST